MIDSKKVITIFNKLFSDLYKTKLQGGAKEPFYKASKNSKDYNIILFRENLISSALHEISHWCIAGKQRRNFDDYNYWYSPDTRTNEEQLKFYKVEVKPQALEKLFSETIKLDFNVSLDNFSSTVDLIHNETRNFELYVNEQFLRYKNTLPIRAKLFNEELKKHV